MLVRILAAVLCAAAGWLVLLALHRAAAKAAARKDLEEIAVIAVASFVARMIVSIALAAVLILVGLFLFIRSEVGGHDVCALAQATIEDVAHQQVFIGHCKLDPLEVRVVIDDVRVGPPQRLLFSATKLSAGLDQAGVLAGRLKLDRLVIDRPRILVDLSKPSTKPPGRKRPPGAACLPDLTGFKIGRVTIHDGSFHALLPGERGLALEGFGASIDGDGDELSLDLKAIRTTLADSAGATSATRTQLKGKFDFVRGAAQLERVELSGAEGSVTADGALDSICALQGHANANVSLDLGLLHNHLLRSIPNLAGRVSVHTSAKFAGENFDAQIKADVEDSEILEFEPGTFSIEATANRKRLTVQRITVPLEHGKVVAKGTVDLTSPFELNANATLDGFSLGEVLERVGVPGLPVHVTGAGTASIAGPLATEHGIDLEGAVDMKVHEFGVYNRSWRRRNSKGTVRFAGFTEGTLKTDYHLTQRQIELSDAKITTRGSDIRVDGTVFFQVEKGLDLTVDAPRVTVGDIGPFAGVNVQGQGSIDGTITGGYLGLDIRGDAQLGAARVLGYDLGDVTGSVDLDLARGMLTATNMQGEKGDSMYAGNGRMSFRDGVTMEARARLDAARLGDLLDIARANFPVLNRISSQADATLTGDVELSGPAARPTIETQLKLAAVSVAGQSFETGALRAQMTEAREIEVSSLQLRRGVAELNAKGWYRFQDQAYRVRAASRKVSVGDIDALKAAVPRLTGKVDLAVEGEGTLKYPKANGKLKLGDWYLGEQPSAQPIATVAVGVDLDGQTLTVSGEVVSPWPAGSRAPPQMPDEPLPHPPNTMSAEINATVQLAGDYPYKFSAPFRVPDASVLMRPGAMAGASANVSGSIEASGQLLKFLTTTDATFKLDELGATIVGRTVENSSPAHAIFKNGVLTVDSFPLKGTLFDMDASGSWTMVNSEGQLDIGGPKNVTLTGGLDLAILKALLPKLDLDETKGHVGVTVEVRAGDRAKGRGVVGSVGESLASITGTAELSDVELRAHNLPIGLTDGKGTLLSRFQLTRLADGTIGIGEDDGTISIEHINAKLNDSGRLSISGAMHADQHTIRDADLTLQLDDVPLRLAEDTTLVLSGRPELIRRKLAERDDPVQTSSERPVVVRPAHKEEWENKLGGTLEVKRFRYTHDLEPERALANLVDFSRRPQVPQVFSHEGDFLDLDVGIAFDDVQITNNLVKARLDANNLRLTGTNRRPGLTGSIAIAEGHAHVYSAEFSVASGVLNFTDPNSLSPVIALRADAPVSHEQQEYNIHFALNGTLQDYKVDYWSEPELTKADITELLTLGTMSTDLERAGGTTALWGGLADKVVRASGLASQLRKLLPDNTVFKDVQARVSSDYIEQTGVVEPVGQLELKVLNDNWTLRGQTSLLGPRGRKAQLNARLFKHVDGQLQWDGDKPTAPSYGDVGADFRIHWEKQ